MVGVAVSSRVAFAWLVSQFPERYDPETFWTTCGDPDDYDEELCREEVLCDAHRRQPLRGLELCFASNKWVVRIQASTYGGIYVEHLDSIVCQCRSALEMLQQHLVLSRVSLERWLPRDLAAVVVGYTRQFGNDEDRVPLASLSVWSTT